MRSILIVDDDEQVRSILKRFLSPDSEVIEADNGVKGLRLYEEHPIDVVMTDIYMPDKDGLEVIRHLAGADRAPAIIAMSGQWEMYGCDCSVIARALGAGQILTKPFMRGEVMRAINDALDEGNPATVGKTQQTEKISHGNLRNFWCAIV